LLIYVLPGLRNRVQFGLNGDRLSPSGHFGNLAFSFRIELSAKQYYNDGNTPPHFRDEGNQRPRQECFEGRQVTLLNISAE
jgi:hypothetical protein